MKLAFLIVLGILVVSGCGDNPVSLSKAFNIQYTGITETLDGPNPIGSVDPDDWYYFGPDTVKNGVIKSNFKIYPAYPNPTKRYALISLELPTTVFMQIIVDDPAAGKTTILANKSFSPGRYNLSIDFLYGDSTFSRQEGISRVFFNISSNNNYPNVHGDIQYKK